MKILLDYVFPITVISSIPAAATGFLKRALVVAKPKTGQEGNVGTIYTATAMAAITARTDNANAQQLFDAGMSTVYLLLADDLDLETYLTDENVSDFYTVLISDDYDDADVTAITIGSFEGVIAVSSDDNAFLATQAAIENRVAFFGSATNGSKNMMYAFGKLLSSTNWINEQYISMPFDDGINTLGDADSLFEDRVSFVLNDDEFGNRLALFAAGGKAIVAPYIIKNLMIDLQSKTLQWISANQPRYTLAEAALLENRLQEDVMKASYIDTNLISDGVVEITLEEDNFVGTGSINIAEPKALWRVFSEMRQTL